MKNSKKTLIVLRALLSGFLSIIILSTFLTGCSNEPEPETDYEGLLTINNSPPEYSFIVLVYPSSILPTTFAEYSSMATASIAGGMGTSPVKLSWTFAHSNGKKSGNYLVTVTSGSIKKIVIGNFNKGKATVNWNNMTDLYSLFSNENNGDDNETDNNDNDTNKKPTSTLDVKNAPDGYYDVRVYNRSFLTYQKDYEQLTGALTFAMSQKFPCLLEWTYLSYNPQTLLVTITPVAIGEPKTFFIIANFDSKGDATVDWNDLIEVSSLPYDYEATLSKSTLTISNGPSSTNSFSVKVYSSSNAPTTQKEFKDITYGTFNVSLLIAYSGDIYMYQIDLDPETPIQLKWYTSIQSGPLLVVINRTPFIGSYSPTLFIIANFDDDGNATVDWDSDDLIEVPSLPYD